MSNITSNIISYLRFPLCVAIIMVHSDIAIYNTTVADNTIYQVFDNFFIDSICKSAVALFFFISGYLFFHEGTFSIQIYKKKIYNRFKSLLIPYLLWNTICLAIIFILQQFCTNFNLLLHKHITNFNLQDFFYVFWNIQKITEIPTDQPGPLVGQFWFLQCLFIFILLSPLIYIAIKKTRIVFPLVILFLSITDVIPNMPGFNTTSLYYFALGSFFSITKSKWYSVKSYTTFIFIIGYVLTYTCRLYLKLDHFKIIDETLLIFSLLDITYKITKGKKLKKQTLLLCNCSFFAFAIHRYFTSIGLNLIKNWQFNNAIEAIVCFIMISIISTLCCILSYQLMQHFLPKTTQILNGKRIK